ncbi:MAG: cytochrome C [Euryarchaeota archaeon]|nr:cytochrome C [Euryarchaeota archaeon]
MRAAIGGAVLLLVLLFPVYADSCVDCHGSREKMEQLGYPQFYFPLEEVREQTGMPATCVDCHLGNPEATDLEEAHRGVLSVQVVSKKAFSLLDRENLMSALTPNGSRLTSMLPKDRRVNTLIYHDREPELFTFNRSAVERTCGKCHPRQVEEFARTVMGSVRYQSMYRNWTDTQLGPHNCGPWYLDHWEEIASESSANYTYEQARINQKACNRCHVSCLDCHYAPFEGEGVHRFERTPSPVSCYGGGRGSICHAGPEERRRGAGYLGAEFSKPPGREPDVHVKYNLTCVDCHDPLAKGGMGGVEREASCTTCHGEIAEAVSSSDHASVACESCHIKDVGGYQLTVWGPGKVAGVATPYKKYRNYYGEAPNPILIRDASGKWIPVKPFPMVTVGVAKEVKGKPGPSFRRNGSRDAFALVGTFDGLPENNLALLWFQMDKMSHAIRKEARDCESCHASTEQGFYAKWKFTDQGAEPFEGEHRIVANSSGLYALGLRNTTPIVTKKGWSIADLAPWYYLRDKFYARGDYSLPEVEEAKYAAARAEAESFLEEYAALEQRLSRAGDAEKLEELEKVRAIGVHNPQEGIRLLKELGAEPAPKPEERGVCGPTAVALLAALTLALGRCLRRA